MALHYYGYQSCRNSDAIQRGGRNMTEPHSESGGSVPGLSDLDSDSGGSSSSGSGSGSTGGSTNSSDDPTTGLPYPGIAPVTLRYLTQTTRPRNWCLALISNPWFERISMLVILLNCITLGMYQPCNDENCDTNRCKILQIFDDFIFAFFSLEMTIKMIAMGVYGKGTYLADYWNFLDFFIVIAGALEYLPNVENLNLSAIRTIRVLRPLRAINRIPSMRILVMLLLDTLPMLGNVLLLCFFVFFIFGIVGVQLWQGLLRQRCYFHPTNDFMYPEELSRYYTISQEQEYICSRNENSGMHPCNNLPPYTYNGRLCNATAVAHTANRPTNTSCVNWNQYYTDCLSTGDNPFQGTISFDNIGMAWVAIFLVISLEGWTDIMYYVQDAHSFWDWIYFVLLIVIGSFFMINLCLVVIATQFSETKKREMERMRMERARFQSTSTLASSTNNSEPTTCYAEIVKYIAHLWRQNKRRMIKKLRLWRYRRQQRREQTKVATQSSRRPPVVRTHHPNCPRLRNISQQQNAVSQQAVILQSISSTAESGGRPAVARLCAAVESPVEALDVTVNRRPGLLRVPSMSAADSASADNSLLSPSVAMNRRRSSVMFSDVVLLHGGTSPGSTGSSGNAVVSNVNISSGEKNVCSSEKMTQTGDGNIWQITTIPSSQPMIQSQHHLGATEYCELNNGETMTCQELLAVSGALSAALPTGQTALDSFFCSLTKGITGRQQQHRQVNVGGDTFLFHQWPTEEDFVCCQDLLQCENGESGEKKNRSRVWVFVCAVCRHIRTCYYFMKKYVKCLVEQKRFQQGILLAILINTLSMGVEFHNQPQWLTTVVEISNIAFSAIFAVEMLLKVIAEGPFGYISNGFNVFDGVIVVLSAVELCKTFLGEREGSSGLSVLRTFRLLRILKLVRFMPNLRRQLFVMLRTMDNVAVFFSLLILFIFIFSILGMILFGGKFCKYIDDDEGNSSRECTCVEIAAAIPQCECDRKHFNNFLWATVTVFQILTQEDWNMVLSNGMAKTSHWAALYFVALMTFGNYVLFNLLVAILVEGFSSERNERREREQRELAKSKLSADCYHSDPNDVSYEDSRSISEESDTFPKIQGIKNTWRSAEELHKVKDSNGHRDRLRHSGQCHIICRPPLSRDCSEEPKCNIQKESKMLQQPFRMNNSRAIAPQPPIITHTAATPQDSPNTTLEPGTAFKDFCYSLSHSSLIDSIDSIDRSSCNSVPSLLKPPPLNDRSNNTNTLTPPSTIANLLPTAHSNTEKHSSDLNLASKFITHNEKVSTKATTFSEKLFNPPLCNNNDTKLLENQKNIVTEKLNGTLKNFENGEKCKIQRGYSWKISRASLRRKNSVQKSRSGSDSDTVLILNNGRNHAKGNGSPRDNSFRKNDSLGPVNRIQNDTQGETPNNKSVNGLSPQNSVRSQSSACAAIRQVGWQQNRQNSLTSYLSTQSKVIPFNVQNLNHHSHRLSLTSDIVDRKTINNLNEKISDSSQLPPTNEDGMTISVPIVEEAEDRTRTKLQELFKCLEPEGLFKEKEEFSLYIFPPENRCRIICCWLVNQKWFDNVVLLFIALNCITLAMERPNIPPTSTERIFLAAANYVFTVVFALEMFVKVVAAGMCYGPNAYFTSGWNIMDGSLVIISIVDVLMSIISESSPRIFGILRVFRLLRSLRPLRVINRAPGLKLVVQTLLSSLRPIGNIVLICCTFFIIFGILGVQLFKGTFFYCKGENSKGVRNRSECEGRPNNKWVNQKYNFDDLGKALMSLFVLSSRDGWVNIMYTGLDAVGVDQQPIVNYSEWRLLYFISFILLVGFFVLNMFVGVVVENFHRCREEQEKEERVLRAAKRALQLEKRRRKMNEPPYYTNYSKWRLFIHSVVTSKYFDLAIAAVIGLNVVTMAMECYNMPDPLKYALKIFNYFFTAVFILESSMKLLALGFILYLKDKWNQLDVGIVILSVVGIVLDELESKIIPINPTVLRVMRVLRIARVLKLLKMAKGIRALLDTVMQALPQVGNLGLLFFLLFFIFAALGVELFGRLECSDEHPCQGLGEHAHFSNFGMAFLTLFRVATGDNWNGIMKDTLRTECDDSTDCVKNCCVSTIIAPIFFVIFVLMAQFVLVNVVVAVLMKHLEESHKQLEDDMDVDTQIERELQEQQEQEELCLALQMQAEVTPQNRKPLTKVLSLPSNFTYNSHGVKQMAKRRQSMYTPAAQMYHNQYYNRRRRQTFHSQALLAGGVDCLRTHFPYKYEENYENQFNEDYEKTLQCNEPLYIQTGFDEEDYIAENDEDTSVSKRELLRMHSEFCDDVISNYSISKNVSETKNNEEKALLNIGSIEKKPAHRLYGSTRHLFKQKAIDIDPLEESLLLSIDIVNTTLGENMKVPSIEIPEIELLTPPKSECNLRKEVSDSLLLSARVPAERKYSAITLPLPTPPESRKRYVESKNPLCRRQSSEIDVVAKDVFVGVSKMKNNKTANAIGSVIEMSTDTTHAPTSSEVELVEKINICIEDASSGATSADKQTDCETAITTYEDIQKIIAERRKVDENARTTTRHNDIFESSDINRFIDDSIDNNDSETSKSDCSDQDTQRQPIIRDSDSVDTVIDNNSLSSGCK